MSEQSMRDCLVMAVAGKKKVGKTVETTKMIYRYVSGNPAKNIPGRKVLIFDVNDEFSDFWYFGEQHSIKAIAIKDIPHFTNQVPIEARRVRPYKDDGTPMTLDDMSVALEQILSVYRRGLLLVEDINKYVGDTHNRDLIGALATCRHIGVDCIMHFQNVGRIGHPKIIGNCNYVRLHKTTDDVARHHAKFEEKLPLMQIAEIIVNSEFEKGNQRFSVYIDMDNSKIVGDFTEEQKDSYVLKYMAHNQRQVLKPLLDEVNAQGQRVYTRETATKYAIQKLKQQYF